jgi:glycosyltransferase involved in cell wall biosynthesis
MIAERPWRLIASNLHAGGGVQVAASLLDEIAQLTTVGEWQGVSDLIDAEVSSEVLANLRPDTVERLAMKVVNRRPSRMASKLSDARGRYASVLTVFGPLYSAPRAGRRIMGYADVTSLYPDPSSTGVSPGTRARRSLRSHMSRMEASRQDLLVVETDAMKDRLRDVLGSSCPQIEVVANAVNARVLDAELDVRIADVLERERRTADVLFSFPTRAYPHKNLKFLPLVRHQLLRRGIDARFVVTLRHEEWTAQSPEFRLACLNLGEVTVEQIATVMRLSDGIFFPSLLEAYSATPIEALALGTPLFASDRKFVRSTCRDAAVYFDPLDAMATAETLVRVVDDPGGQASRVVRGKDLVRQLPTATDRARSFLQLMANGGREQR